MRQKIFRNAGILVGIAVSLTFLIVSLVYYGQFSKEMKQGIKNEAQYIRVAMDELGDSYLDEDIKNLTGARITLIDQDGTVLFDSVEEPEDMENHAGRAEVVQARQTGVGEATRISDTLGQQTFYYALLLDNHKVVRLALTVDSIFTTMGSGFTLIILVLVIVLVIAIFVTREQTNRIIEPINQIDLEHPLEHEVYEELTPLMRRINKQNQLIEEQVEKLKQNHEEYLAITENMKDGMIITNQSLVLGINKAATKLFRVSVKDCLHKSILTVSRNEELRDALESAIEGRATERMIELEGKVLQILANPVSIQENHHGAVLLILDVTEREKSESMRREFSANVSHELKTPLMSISGYAELMMNNMVKPQDIPEFSKRIYTEANRLTTLVEDIIKLSKLDEQGNQLQYEDVDIFSVTQDVFSCLQLQASKKDIKLSLIGNYVEIYGVRQILYEMIYNLCDNAIKYNKDHGKVKVHVLNEQNDVIWTVSDTGIGIEKEHQGRVFERFYRVDKSHSRETGGTGLGLSIVKHGALIHHGVIHVESKLGQGTEISIRFRKNIGE